MKINVEMDGLNELIGQINRREAGSDDLLIDVITDAVTDTQAFAVAGLKSGPATGRVYEKYNPRRTHRASAPGEYPMTDTGQLQSNIGIVLPTPGRIEGKVGTDIMHGRYLEFGTSKMAARPWLLRSFERAKAGIMDDLRRRWERMK